MGSYVPRPQPTAAIQAHLAQSGRSQPQQSSHRSRQISSISSQNIRPALHLPNSELSSSNQQSRPHHPPSNSSITQRYKQKALEKRQDFDKFAADIEQEYSESKKTKKGKKDTRNIRNYHILEPFLNAGKLYHCNVSMNISVAAAINDGMDEETRQKLTAARAANDQQVEPIEELDLTLDELAQRDRNISTYKRFTQLHPMVKQRLDECAEYGNTECQEILVATLELGVSECARNDRKTVKKEVTGWIPVVVERVLHLLDKDPANFNFPPLATGTIKAERGINDPQMAMLLTPWQFAHRFWIESNNLADIQIVQNDIKTGVIPAMASDSIPAFLFDWTKYHSEQMLRGNLLGPLFIAAFKCIMTSPSSALEPKPQPTRSGNAKIRGIKEVSSQNLAYVATVLRFSMSPLQSYSKKDGNFNERVFYDWMVDWIDNAPTSWKAKTFRTLNQEIFGAEDDDEDEEPALDSDLVLLHQHMNNYVDSDEERGSDSEGPANGSDKENQPVQSHSLNPRVVSKQAPSRAPASMAIQNQVQSCTPAHQHSQHAPPHTPAHSRQPSRTPASSRSRQPSHTPASFHSRQPSRTPASSRSRQPFHMPPSSHIPARFHQPSHSPKTHSHRRQFSSPGHLSPGHSPESHICLSNAGVSDDGSADDTFDVEANPYEPNNFDFNDYQQGDADNDSGNDEVSSPPPALRVGRRSNRLIVHEPEVQEEEIHLAAKRSAPSPTNRISKKMKPQMAKLATKNQ